jgi:AcrR family transcriptional regulator
MTSVTKRGRPRSAEADESILAATVDTLVERGYERLTIEAVAIAAGVAKTTIYRRWPSKPELVLAAVGHLTADLPVDDTGSLRGDLVALVGAFIDRLLHTPLGELVRAMQLAVAEQPALGEAAATGFMAERRREVDVIVDRALGRGELQPGVDRELVFDLCIGAVFMRFQVTRQPLTVDHAERIVDAVLLGYPNVPR